MAAKLPLWTPATELIHIGTLNLADKGTDSLEGAGLSVSEHPLAWLQIARLGGMPWWSASREAGEARFLDWHAMSGAQTAHVLRWGLVHGLCELCEAWALTSTCPDSGQTREMLFEHQAEAGVELLELLLQDPGARMESRHTPRLTPAAQLRVGRSRVDLSETQHLLATLFVADATDLDGVHWNEELEVAALSAPRAVIVPERLDRWSFAPWEGDAPRAAVARPVTR